MGLHLLVNATSARIGGGLSYLRQQLQALEQVRPDWRIEVLTSRWNARHFQESLASEVHELHIATLSQRVLYEQALLPFRARRADVLYCPRNFAPLPRTGVPLVLTLQNPNYWGVGRLAWASRARGRFEVWASDASMRRADRVVVISDSLFAEVAECNIDRTRFVVIKSGRPEWTEDPMEPRELALSAPFFLSLANDYAHKRLDVLVRGWDAAFRQSVSPPSMVLVGDVGDTRRRNMVEGIPPARRDLIVFTGPIEERAVVRWLLEHALGLVSASVLEAFPLTLLEAGSLGCPLVLSDIPSHHEVAAERATYFPPDNEGSLAATMRSLAVDPPQWIPWAWPVSWRDNAEQLAQVFEELVDSNNGPTGRTRSVKES